MKKTLLFIFSALALSACAAKYSAEDFTIKEQKEATEELVDRVTGGRADEFSVVISPDQKDGKDWFLYHAQDGRVVLEGNNGVSVASALGHYLKTHCGWHLSWCGSQQTLPQQLPLPDEKYEAVSPYKYRYYLNYCTFNYSMSWWDFERWQQEIDFMAL